MKNLFVIFLFLLWCTAPGFSVENDIFSHNGIQYQVTKEDKGTQEYEVCAIHYDSAYIVLPDSITNGACAYAVTNAIQWYNPQTCALRHYCKVDMSAAAHILHLNTQISGLIAVDTLILPPNLQRFPMRCWTTDSLSSRTQLMDEENLLPGIHRIWSTGTLPLEDLRLNECTSLIEADLSTYTSTLNKNRATYLFCCNPFLEKLILPNTVERFDGFIFDEDIRLTDLPIPDSLKGIYAQMATELSIDTLKLGKEVSHISHEFAAGWRQLRHIEVDTANPHFMDDEGVLYTKDQSTLRYYPFSRDGSEYHMSPVTTAILNCGFAYGGVESDITGVWDYVQRHKTIADMAPLKTLICTPYLTYLGSEATFEGTGIRTIGNFGENGIKVIPVNCFKYAAIDSITLPLGLTDIEALAFAGAYNLHRIDNLPRLKHLKYIGESAFRDAWQLERMDLLPCNLLLEIPQEMCSNDSSLLYVALPRNVQTIKDRAFKNCISLQQIVCPAVVPVPVNSNVFEGVDKQNCVLKVPSRSLNLYQSAPVWQEFFQMDTTGFYYVETAVSDSLAGIVIGGGAYLSGEYAVITATANDGYKFVSWADGYQYDYRQIQVTKDESFTAIFESALEAIETTQDDALRTRPILRDGQIYIVLEDKTYTIQGQKIE